MPLNRPAAQFPTIFAYFDFPVVQDGATAKSPPRIRSGPVPFKYRVLHPRQPERLHRQHGLLGERQALRRQLVVDSSFTDPNAIFNALLAGKINLFPSLPLVTARQQVFGRPGADPRLPFAAQSYMFAMRVDKGQFADNRVRTAFKLLVDRQAMIDGALAGFGTVAYDLLAPGTQYYASDLKRTQDVEKARSLFKAAGVLGDTFVLPTTNFLPGMVESSTILAQQAAAAGVKVVVKTRERRDVLHSGRRLPLARLRARGRPALWVAAGGLPVRVHASWPPTPTRTGATRSRAGKQAEQLISQAIAATDPTSAKSLWRKAQQQQFDEGGYLVWANLPYVDAAANNVRGLSAGAGFSYYNWRLCDGWLASS